MTTPQLNNLGPNTKGRDFNFYQKAAITSTTFANIPDMKITFTTQSVLFLNENSAELIVLSALHHIHGSILRRIYSIYLLFSPI